MTQRVDIPAVTGEVRQECAETTAVPPVNDNRKIPVAYEEVILTEEAEELLEKSARPPRRDREGSGGRPVSADRPLRGREEQARDTLL